MSCVVNELLKLGIKFGSSFIAFTLLIHIWKQMDIMILMLPPLHVFHSYLGGLGGFSHLYDLLNMGFTQA